MPGPLTLKQRLHALSVNASSSSSNNLNLPVNTQPSSPRSPGPRIRAFLASNLGRRNTEDGVGEGATYSHDKVQEVIGRMIFQAGVDYETRPMVVMNASAFPDPKEVNYDLLLARILSYLNLYVEADYTVVFFAAGGRHTPGWNWVWKAYRSLSRKYRKNLKKLFIVHSNFFTKMLFSLAGAIISPKFFRKITYIDTLSELAYHVPLTQIDIPPAVYQENLKHERQITLPVATRADLFGVPLEELMGLNGEKGGIPRVVKDCLQFLRETGLQEEGLFRRSPNSALLKQVQQAYDRGHVVSLDMFGDPHLAAVLLKKYLRDLPDPLFPESSYPIIKKCPVPSNDPSDMSNVNYIRESLLPELPPCTYILLNHIMHLLHEVSLRSASNRMDAHNLAVVIAPNLVKGSSPIRDVAMCAIPGGPTLYPGAPTTSLSNPAALAEGKNTLGLVIKTCIQRYYEIFDDLPDPTEAIAQQPTRGLNMPGARPPSPSLNGQPFRVGNRESMYDDEEDIDDAMLVMPIGPSGVRTSASGGQSASPPTAWNAYNAGTTKARHRSNLSRDSTNNSGSGARSVYTTATNGNGNGQWQYTARSKSMISIEKGNGSGAASRKGSIAIGRGTTKSSGSSVEAMGITAGGFFTAPESAPPVPPRPGQCNK
ncbi:Rho GTPase activation protein [Panus rudis PR-1116 ss-1]|nr:Rho GTPase activation protein [Panus rudis PR-1116 ss-1]